METSATLIPLRNAEGGVGTDTTGYMSSIIAEDKELAVVAYGVVHNSM